MRDQHYAKKHYAKKHNHHFSPNLIISDTRERNTLRHFCSFQVK